MRGSEAVGRRGQCQNSLKSSTQPRLIQVDSAFPSIPQLYCRGQSIQRIVGNKTDMHAALKRVEKRLQHGFQRVNDRGELRQQSAAAQLSRVVGVGFKAECTHLWYNP